MQGQDKNKVEGRVDPSGRQVRRGFTQLEGSKNQERKIDGKWMLIGTTSGPRSPFLLQMAEVNAGASTAGRRISWNVTSPQEEAGGGSSVCSERPAPACKQLMNGKARFRSDKSILMGADGLSNCFQEETLAQLIANWIKPSPTSRLQFQK